MKDIDLPELSLVDEKLRELAAEQPDRTSECLYVTTNVLGPRQPECIVGHALADLGVPLDALAGVDGFHVGTLYGISNEFPFARRVQSWQDAGFTWSQAVDLADRFEEDDDVMVEFEFPIRDRNIHAGEEILL